MSVTRVVDERVLIPISAEKPAGEDLRALKDWVAIKKANSALLTIAISTLENRAPFMA